MSNRYFSKNRKSYKKVFNIIRPKRIHILEALDRSIKNKDDKKLNSLLESVEDKNLKGLVSKIKETKEKLEL